MPEGHTLHRLARQHQKQFGGTVVHASSPQGRFVEGAERIDGSTLVKAEAYGKHLLHHYSGGTLLHVHLGLYGKFTSGRRTEDHPEPPEPRGALRLRLVNDDGWADLRGATACELMEPGEVEALLARLGPDPLAPRPDGTDAWERLSRSKRSIASLLMDQKVIAGIGNVYRAEVLFRHRIDPFRPGRAVPRELFDSMWTDLVTLMRAGVRAGRIVTIRDEDRPHKGHLNRGESVYVYRRTGQPCRVCGTEVRTQELEGRNLFWCPSCQAPD